MLFRSRSITYTPIILHFYNGVLGTLQLFGHVGVQIGNTYYTYDHRNKDTCASATDISNPEDITFAIERDTARYGNHFALELPAEWYKQVNELPLEKTTFEQAWSPRAYETFNKNCVNCTAGGFTAFMNLPEELYAEVSPLTEQRALLDIPPTPKDFIKIIEKFNKKEQQKFAKEIKAVVQSGEKKDSKTSEPLIQIFIEKIIDKTIYLLNVEAFCLNCTSSSKSRIDQIQKTIFILMELKNAISKTPLKNLSQLLSETQKKVTKLDKLAVQSLDFCKTKLALKLTKLDEKAQQEEDKRYHESKQKELEIKNKLFLCHCKYQKLIRNIDDKFPRDKDIFHLSFNIRNELERTYKAHMTAIKNGNEPDIEEFDMRFKVLNDFFEQCILQFNLEKIYKYLNDSQGPIQMWKNLKPVPASVTFVDELHKKITEFIINLKSVPIDKMQDSLKEIGSMLVDLNAQAHKIGVEHKDTKSEPATSPSPITISWQHVEWLEYQIKKINFWYDKNKKSTNKIAAQDLQLQACFLQSGSQREDLPFDQFHKMLGQIRYAWCRAAAKYNTIERDKEFKLTAEQLRSETAIRTCAYLNENAKDHSFGRDIGVLIMRAEGMLGKPSKEFKTIVAPYSVPFSVLNSEINAKIVFEDILNNKLLLLPNKSDSDKSIKLYLIETARFLQKLVASNVLNYQQAARELLEEVTRSIESAGRKSTFSAALEKIVIDVSTETFDHEEKKEERPLKLFEFVGKALDESKTSVGIMHEFAILFGKIKASKETEEKKFEKLVQQTKEMLSRPGSSDKRETLTKPFIRDTQKHIHDSPIIFLQGVVNLSGHPLNHDSPLKQIRDLGCAKLSSAGSIASETESDSDSDSPHHSLDGS